MGHYDLPSDSEVIERLREQVSSLVSQRNGLESQLAEARAEIERLEAKVGELSNIALAHYTLQAHYGMLESDLAAARTEAAAQRELATLLERESIDPLTRIAAALERPSREWVAALTLVGAARDCPTYESTVTSAFKFADALLAEMGEG